MFLSNYPWKVSSIPIKSSRNSLFAIFSSSSVAASRRVAAAPLPVSPAVFRSSLFRVQKRPHRLQKLVCFLYLVNSRANFATLSFVFYLMSLCALNFLPAAVQHISCIFPGPPSLLDSAPSLNLARVELFPRVTRRNNRAHGTRTSNTDSCEIPIPLSAVSDDEWCGNLHIE